MCNLSRKIAKRRGKRGGKLDAYNQHFLEVARTSQITRHMHQMHPTKGPRLRRKAAVIISQMTPSERWDKLIAPTIRRARKYAKRVGR